MYCERNPSTVRNILSSPTKSFAHNTNSQELATFNYSHLADTFIQNTFSIPPRCSFFPSVVPVGIKTFAAFQCQMS